MPGDGSMDQLSNAATAALSVVAGGGLFGFLRWLMTRHADAVTEFRKALDRGLRRENALVTVCELQVAIIDEIQQPTRAQLELRKRAIAVLELAQRDIYGGQK